MTDLRAQLQSTLGAAYSIDRELDGGGMSRVFVAEERALSRRVVVKVVPPDIAGTVNIDRFKREIQLAARLQHAHIVPVLTAGESDGIPYYTMPFVDGRSLRDRLREAGPFPIGEAVGTLRDVARALAYAHEHGVVHRDIKPDNVLVSGGSAMVTDFGIAKAISESRSVAPHATLTQVGVAVGTPSYMSPEQSAGDPLSDHRSDIYSFGCLAYELLAGRPPFVSKSPQKLLASHMGETPVPIADLRPETPRVLATLIARTLEKDPNLRPQTAAELLAVLDGEMSTGAHAAASAPILLPEPRAFAKALAFYAVAFVVVVGLAKGANMLGAPDWVVTWAAILMAIGLPTVLATGFAHHATRRILAATPTRTTGGTRSPTRGPMESLAIVAAQRLTWRRTTLGGVSAITALVIVTATLMIMGRAGLGPLKSVFSTGALRRSDLIMIGPVTVTNADTSLGPSIELGVRTEISDSKVIRLVSEASANRALTLMRVDSSAKFTPALARAVARRVGAKAVLDATLTGAGPGRFIISLQLVSADSGRQLTAVQAPTSADGLIDAITSVSREMRARIGESLRTVNETPALSAVTTSSIDALRAYTEGRRALLKRDDKRALALLQSAVTLDSTFATAWRSLRAAIANSGGPLRDQFDAMEHARRYAERAPPAEREWIESEYLGYNKLDRANSIRLREKQLATGDTVDIANTAGRYSSRRDFSTAEALLRAEVSRDSGYEKVIQRSSLISVLIDLRRFAAADSFWTQWRPHWPVGLPSLELTYNSRGLAALRRQLDSVAKAPRPAWFVAGWVGTMALMEGRVSAWASSPAVRRTSWSATPALDSVVSRVWPVAVILDHPDRALRELDSAASNVSLSSIWEFDRHDVQVATAYAQAGNPARAEKILADYEHELTDTSLIRYVQPFLHTARGEILLAEHKPLDAIKEFRTGDVAPDGPADGCTICLPARLGRAFDKAGMPDSAITWFHMYLTTPYSSRTAKGQDPSLLALIEERLAQLYDNKGARDSAATYYAKFIDLWKNADPELQPRVAAARARLARLSEAEKSR
jgi:tRNA A-37 threonylcarbamoyl transferase component Bud32